jgi:DeoR family transcriptional regulator of aga operon
MIGGVLRQLSNSFAGPQAERMISELHADHCFLGVDGLDPVAGATTPDVREAQLDALTIQVSAEATILADASRIGKRSLSVIGSLPSIHRLITDDRIAPEMVRAFHDKGLELIIV